MEYRVGRAMWRKLVLVVFLSAALAGCFSQPRPPELFISTVPPGASCTVGPPEQPIAVVPETPGIALVEPGLGEVTVHCRRHAFADAVATATARPKGTSFVAGRAQYDYPGTVTLVMTPQPPGLSR